jgi:tRNA(Ile)-lysidine synthase
MNKLEFYPAVKTFQKEIKIYLPEGTNRMVAGISGGPDSMCLLYILHRLNFPVLAVHCNYGLRGDASEQDQQLVEEMCSLWGIDCVTVRFDYNEFNQKNFQAWARDRRYQVFNDLMLENKYDFIVTAHHRDDQIETILQKVLRGAGLSAWKGMDVLDGNLFRPLLTVKKSEIMQFLHDFNVPYRIDSSNEESTYARNFIRNHWFPDLNKLFPGWKNNLLEIPKRAKEFDKMTEYVSRQVLNKAGAIKRDHFLMLDENLRPVVLHSILKKKLPEIHISKTFLNNISGLETIQTGSSITITDHYSIIRDRDIFVITDNRSNAKNSIPITRQQIREGKNVAGFAFKVEDLPELFNPDMLYLDMNKIVFPIRIRTWQAGDSFMPFGMKGTQLISDHLTNRKIPSSVKRSAQVIELSDRTICAVLFPIETGCDELGTISEIFRCTSSTKQTLTIQKINP